jgi:hypothetical protein
MSDPARDLNRIEELLLEIRDTLLRMEATQVPAKCSAADREILTELLPGIVGMLGSLPFTVSEILRDPALCSIVRMNAHKLGALLARAASDGAVINGLVVERLGIEHGACVWKVVARLPEPIARDAVRVFNRGRRF